MPTLSKRSTKLRKARVRKKKREKTKQLKANLASGRAKSKAAAKERRRASRAVKATTQIVEMGGLGAPGRITRDEALQFVAGAGEFAPQVVAAEEEMGLLHCPACQSMRPAEDFIDVPLVLGEDAPEVACKFCRENGVRPAPVVPGIDPRAAYAIQRRAQGASYVEIAGEVKLSPQQVREICAGQTTDGATARRAFALALRQVGVDPVALAKKGAELLRAKKTIFYKGDAIEDVEDNTTQATTWRHMTRLADLEPPKVVQKSSRQVRFKTNLDSPHPNDRSGEITLKVSRKVG